MEEWFRRPALVRPSRIEDTPPNFGPPLLNVITMDWVLGFPRAKSVYDSMLNNKIWMNEKAKREIGRMLEKTGVIAKAKASPNTKILFGDLTSSNVIEIERNYIQRAEQNSNTEDWTFDDLTASPALFTFRIAVKGDINYKSGKSEVTLEAISIYVKDQYDFINEEKWSHFNRDCYCYDQSLGGEDIWGNEVGKVTNNSFNNWRERTGRGGDFLIYSDLKVTKLIPPNIFTI